MADRINFSVHITPKETLTDEQGNDYDVIAGEIGTSLGGSGDSISLANYSGTLAQQGYKDGAVGYLDCVHTAGGVVLSSRSDGDFFFIRNTGFKFSSTTALGTSTTDCIMVAIRINAWDTGATAGWTRGNDAGAIHFMEIGWLKPGQAAIFPAAANTLAISQFGSIADDLTSLQQESGGENEVCKIYVKTIQADGTAATDGNAVEFLAVD